MDDEILTSNEKKRRARDAALGGVVAICVLIATSFLAERLPLTWDEGDAFYRAESVACWVDATLNVDGERTASDDPYAAVVSSYFATFQPKSRLFSREALAVGFPHAIYREGHPAGYSIVIALGRAVARRVAPWLSEKVAFRFGVLALFATALGAVYYRVARSYGSFAAFAAVVFILLIPRALGHAQIAGGDSVLISSWLLAWTTFEFALRSKRGAALWGAAMGLSFAAKFSGFVLLAPFFLAFAVAFVRAVRRGEARDVFTRATPRFVLGVVVAGLVFFAANPTLWREPFSGLSTFWSLNTRRVGFDVPVFFSGAFYSLKHSLPWWNGFFWLGATVPAPTLFFASFALVDETRSLFRIRDVERTEVRARRELSFFAALALGLTLPVVRAFPGLPVHDGARLLIASFPFWGVLAGVGFVRILQIAQTRARGWRVAVGLGCALAFADVCADLARSAPQYLSFYNATVGGVVGATRKGFEPTYYWDSFDSSVVARLNRELDAARAEGRPSGVLFSAFSTQTLDFYRRWHTLSTDDLATISDPNALKNRGRYGFYVLQRRPSGLTALDWELLKSARPLWRKRIANPINFPFGTKKNDSVVALEVYDFRDVERALRSFERRDASADKDSTNAKTSP